MGKLNNDKSGLDKETIRDDMLLFAHLCTYSTLTFVPIICIYICIYIYDGDKLIINVYI